MDIKVGGLVHTIIFLEGKVMRYLLIALLLIPTLSMADDYTQEQILDEVRTIRENQENWRTWDQLGKSIRRNNEQFEQNWNSNSRDQGLEYKYDIQQDRQWWETPSGLIIEGYNGND